jgi:6-phosphogluconolactonase
VQHTGKGLTPERQEAPQGTGIPPIPRTGFGVAADLGADAWRLGSPADLDGTAAAHRRRAMRAGAGPRHIAFHPALPLGSSPRADSMVAYAALRPAPHPSPRPSSTSRPADRHELPADITSHQTGGLYVSNWPRASIALFSVAEATGVLASNRWLYRGRLAANFSLHPTGHWLLVANQRSDSVIVSGATEAAG